MNPMTRLLVALELPGACFQWEAADGERHVEVSRARGQVRYNVFAWTGMGETTRCVAGVEYLTAASALGAASAWIEDGVLPQGVK